MYRRLIVFGVAVAAVALTAMVIPLALSARDVAQIAELGEAAALARSEAARWEAQVRATGSVSVPDPVAGISYLLPDGAMAGEAPGPDAAPVVAGAAAGRTTTATAAGYGFAASPAFLGGPAPAVVLVTRDPAQMREDLLPRLAAIGAVSILLLALAALAAWRLAKQTAAPLTALTATANRVAEGDLSARAPSSDLREVDQVARALNRAAERVQELLAQDRSMTAELAHQLRTPLTVLSVDIDAVADPAVRERLRDDLDEVQRRVDEIIDTARRPVREGLAAACDAGAVVADRVRFWRVLAEDQGRALHAVVEPGPLPVRLNAEDLATAVDILLQNVFVHTPEGTGFSVAVRGEGGLTEIVVADRGPGFSRRDPDGPGSTGLGLSIAARLAEASGGGLQVETGDGTRARLLLGPPAETTR